MNSLEQIPLAPLDRISPSKYTSLKACAYRVILENTYGNPLLPYAPHGHFGTVVHEAIRAVLKGSVKTTEEFNQKWQDLIVVEENKLVERGFDFMVPLKKSMKKGYSLKKMQVRSLLNRPESTTTDARSSVSFKHEPEVLLESQDGLIAGRADLISTVDSFVRITDFKSGKILADEGDVKQDYEDQLKLYAYLYYSMYDRFPNELVLVDLERNVYQIEFTESDILEAGEEAKRMLSATNSLVSLGNKQELAEPSHDNCSFCLYRPACEYHWELPNTEDNFYANIMGTLEEVKIFRNGNVNATIITNENRVVVSNIPTAEVEHLRNKLNSQIAIYNVFPSENKGWYKAGRTTMIYE
ncbi:MAG: PD-(D/E)XK nuclease family protein [Chitinophagales bacterium]